MDSSSGANEGQVPSGISMVDIKNALPKVPSSTSFEVQSRTSVDRDSSSYTDQIMSSESSYRPSPFRSEKDAMQEDAPQGEGEGEEEPPSVPGSPTYPEALRVKPLLRSEASTPSSHSILYRQNSFDSTAGTIGSPHLSISSLDNPFSSNLGTFKLQSLLVMRHSERADDVDASWGATSSRPWDPPITPSGKLLAFEVGKRLRSEGLTVSRIVCSPFLRCVETASQIASALSAIDCHVEPTHSSCNVPIDPSRVKVSIDYGLAETMNERALKFSSEIFPPDADDHSTWLLPIADLEAALPRGTFDSSAQSTLDQLPKFPESDEDSHSRYLKAFDGIAEKFPTENILCITHGEAVSASVSRITPVIVHSVNFCAYSWSQRVVYFYGNSNVQNEESDIRGFGDWELLIEPETTGISWYYY